jgi:hypothetical protein
VSATFSTSTPLLNDPIGGGFIGILETADIGSLQAHITVPACTKFGRFGDVTMAFSGYPTGYE